MQETEFFTTTDIAFPWSLSGVGFPAFGLFAVLLIGVTLATYARTLARGRLILVMGLRLAALVIALLTTLRPSVGVREEPKIPTTLLIGVDLSESMTVPDEAGGKTRLAAVHAELDKVAPLLDELRNERNTTIEMFGFGPSDFTELTHKYSPELPAKFDRSDYTSYLARTFDRWQSERFLLGHILIGDGRHNGLGTGPEGEAVRWRRAGKRIDTFSVGTSTIDPDLKDVAIASASAISGNPDGSVFIKTDFLLRLVVHARGFEGATVPVEVSFDLGEGYKRQLVEKTKLVKPKDNIVELKLKAPERPGEIKLKVEIPLESVQGDAVPSNNVIETYLNVTKEGIRILYVDRVGYENAAVRRVLQADPRIDLFQVVRQTEEPPTAEELEDFDFERRAYDVIILGNVSGRQLAAIGPNVLESLRFQVMKKGVGLIMTGGHATFLGTPKYPGASGWGSIREFEDLLPVRLNERSTVPDSVYTIDRPRYQFLPAALTGEHYLNRVADTTKDSFDLWNRLNAMENRSRFTGLSPLGAVKETATIFAYASESPVQRMLPLARKDEVGLAPLIVGHQVDKGRVLISAAQDTFLWQRLGRPKTDEGARLHARFWRQLVRWAAHQEDEEGAAFARPELRRLATRTRNVIHVGLRQPGGAPAKEPKFEVRVIAPGENEATTPLRLVVPEEDGGRVVYEPLQQGEYQVKLIATGKDSSGKEFRAEATSRFLAFLETTDEMAIKASDHETLRNLATLAGGQGHRLEELGNYLRELKSRPVEVTKPKPKFYPDWHREKSKGFLPAWLGLFVLLLGTEWGLRRWWGMA